MTNKSATLQRIRITPEMKAKLERLAHDDRRTVSDYVRLALEQHLKSVRCLEELASEDKPAKTWIESGCLNKSPSGPFVIWTSSEGEQE